MRIIVPLQGVVQGRGGVFWGSLIPCALFYFLQLYIRQRRPPSSPSEQAPDAHNNRPPPPAASPSSSSHPASRGPAFVSSRAIAVTGTGDSPYYAGWREYHRNPYHAQQNPEGVIQLGLAENHLSLDLLQHWLASHPEASMWNEDQPLAFKDVAPYQYSHGLPAAKSVMASFLEEVMGGNVSFDADNVVLTAGATAAIDILAFCLAEAGNAFLVPSPYYPGFDRDIKWRNGVELVPVHCPSSEGFIVSKLALEKAYNQTQRQGTTVRALLITSPGNPVGNVLDHDTLRSLLNFAREKHIHVICDEVYAGSVYQGSFVSAAEILASGDYDTNHVHIIYGLSKDLGIPGFRIGVLYTSNDKILSAARNLTRFCTVSSHTQRLLVSLLQDKSFVKTFLGENKKRLGNRHSVTFSRLQQAGIRCADSSGGLYCWIDMRHLLVSANVEEENNLWKRLLYDVKVNLTPGFACRYAEAGWFRLCFANVDEQTLDVALERIRLFTETFRK